MPFLPPQIKESVEGQRKARQWMKRAMHLEKTNRDEDEDDDIRYSAKKNSRSWYRGKTRIHIQKQLQE